MQFADFVSTGFNPIVNLLAKLIIDGLKKACVVVNALRWRYASRAFSLKPMRLTYKNPFKSGLSRFSV
jgi:hypothetical protein